MLKLMIHLSHLPGQSEIIAKTYRPAQTTAGEICFEVTQFLHRCTKCGYTWTTLMHGKEVNLTTAKTVV